MTKSKEQFYYLETELMYALSTGCRAAGLSFSYNRYERADGSVVSTFWGIGIASVAWYSRTDTVTFDLFTVRKLAIWK